MDIADFYSAWHTRAEAHIRAELMRLDIPETDAPERVVLVYRTTQGLSPTGLPEVWLREDWDRRYGSAMPDPE